MTPLVGTIGMQNQWLVASAPPIAGRAANAAGNQAGGTTGTVENQALPAGGAAPSPFGGGFLFVMVGVMVLMILMSTMGARKEKKKRAEMLSAVGRHDRVQTIGGILGTVIEMRDDEVVLRVDDTAGTRITFARSAIQGVLKKASESNAEQPREAALRA